MFSEQKRMALVVDDDPDIVEFMTQVLQSANWDVCIAVNGEQALDQAAANDPDVVFLDINIPEQDGWLVCSKLKMPIEGPSIVLITGRTDSDTNRFAGFVHADEILRKPFSDDDLLRVLNNMSGIAATN
jgi:two-component system KDP operon response regulator KdpE